MICPKCGNDLKEGWKFCPKCGFSLEKKRGVFNEAFDRMERELKHMDKMFERDFEVFDLSPFFRSPVKGKGFSIKITRSGNEKPEVSVKTFGDVDKNEIEEEAGKLGLADRLKTLKPRMKEETSEKGDGVSIDKARTTEEPETSVRNVMGRIVVEVKLPGVKDLNDTEIKSMENSIEIKAIAGDKAYFKILTKPKHANITRKDFKNGILKIELA